MAKRRGGSRLVFGLAKGESSGDINVEWMNESIQVGDSKKAKPEAPSLVKSILNVLNGPGSSIERLAFETDPSQKNSYASLYRAKLRLIPDTMLKRIAIQDDLVATIVRARQNQVSVFGRPRPDRHGVGFVIEPDTGVVDDLDDEAKRQLNDRIEKAIVILTNCGYTKGFEEDERLTFAEYLSLSTRSAVVCGRIATEIIMVDDTSNPGKRKFHAFRATDAGTIYRATKNHEAAQSVRDEAYHLLQDIAGSDEKLQKERFEQDRYAWVQVIDGKPFQAFSSAEMKVYNFYPVPDVELDGYPVTPIDTIISAITTHINITTHNKLYFQSGRATRGMLVLESDDATPQAIHAIKQQFNASINNVNNAWRMPVFGCATGEKIQWQPIDSAGGRDMEFQYLTDMNARVILSAFMMSPDELPGWAYLSRGTNNQALSEGNNEYKLEAARDLGIRPLLLSFEDFINAEILPLIDPELSKQAKVRLAGLDADNAEKEAVRLQQDSALHMTFDEMLEAVEKQPVGRKFCGSIPLNPVYKSYLDQYKFVGEILEQFCDQPGAMSDVKNQYRRDPFFFQWMEMLQAQQQAQAAAQQQAQQAQQAQQGPGGGQPPQGGGGAPPDGGSPPGQDGGPGKGAHAYDAKTENQKTEASQGASASGSKADELARSIDIAYDFLTKSEAQLPADKRKLLAQQRKTSDFVMRGLLDDTADAVKDILAIAEHHAPRGKKS